MPAERHTAARVRGVPLVGVKSLPAAVPGPSFLPGDPPRGPRLGGQQPDECNLPSNLPLNLPLSFISLSQAASRRRIGEQVFKTAGILS
jgi:hypothetical protein